VNDPSTPIRASASFIPSQIFVHGNHALNAASLAQKSARAPGRCAGNWPRCARSAGPVYVVISPGETARPSSASTPNPAKCPLRPTIAARYPAVCVILPTIPAGHIGSPVSVRGMGTGRSPSRIRAVRAQSRTSMDCNRFSDTSTPSRCVSCGNRAAAGRAVGLWPTVDSTPTAPAGSSAPRSPTPGSCLAGVTRRRPGRSQGLPRQPLQ